MKNYKPYTGRDRHNQMIKLTIICFIALTLLIIAALCADAKTDAEEEEAIVEHEVITLVCEEPVPKVVIEMPELVPVPMTPLGEYKVVGYDPYCTHCCPRGDGITASGVPATVGRTCAIEGLPFGTKLYISGLGEFVVEDRGVSGAVIDIACADHAACYAITGTYEVFIINEAVPAEELGW